MKKQVLFISDASSLHLQQTKRFISEFNTIEEFRICTFGDDPDKSIHSQKVDFKFNFHQNSYTYAGWLALITNSVNSVFTDYLPDLVILNGYKLTSFSASIASYFMGCQIGILDDGQFHGIEDNIFPNEKSKEILLNLADFHLTESKKTKMSLIKAKVEKEKIIFIDDEMDIPTKVFSFC